MGLHIGKDVCKIQRPPHQRGVHPFHRLPKLHSACPGHAPQTVHIPPFPGRISRRITFAEGPVEKRLHGGVEVQLPIPALAQSQRIGNRVAAVNPAEEKGVRRGGRVAADHPGQAVQRKRHALTGGTAGDDAIHRPAFQQKAGA